MQIGPIVSSLRRHRAAVFLIVAEIALTCAIVSNSVFLINERLASMNRVSGLAESELVFVQTAGLRDEADAKAIGALDLEALRALPGVKSVAIVNQMPFGGSSWNSDARRTADPNEEGVNAATFFGTEDLVETYGLRIVAGRDFNPDEYVDINDLRSKPDVTFSSIIVTQAFARNLFGDSDAVGKQVYIWGEEPKRIVGIVEHLIRPSVHPTATAENSVILPARADYEWGSYALRVASDRRDETLGAAVSVIEKNDSNRLILNQRSFEEIRNKFFANDRAMAWLLVVVCLALLVITALGIIGLTSFWVQKRRRQIGVRRALGANRSQILRYFQLENLLLTAIGIAVGMALAYGINGLLMKHYEVARLPASYLPIGATLLFLLCQLAVLGPAFRASKVPPAVATRGA